MHHWRSLEETYLPENFLEPSRTQPPSETMSMAELWLTKQRRPAVTGFASPPIHRSHAPFSFAALSL